MNVNFKYNIGESVLFVNPLKTNAPYVEKGTVVECKISSTGIPSYVISPLNVWHGITKLTLPEYKLEKDSEFDFLQEVLPDLSKIINQIAAHTTHRELQINLSGCDIKLYFK